MDTNTILTAIESAKYPLLFLIYLLEGPIAAFLSSVAASIGHLNIGIVWILVIIAEVMADCFFFYVGKKSTNTRVSKKINNLDGDLMKEIKRLSKKRLLFVLMILKLVGPIYLPGFLYLGSSGVVKDRKFLLNATIICIIKDTTIMALGFFAGIGLSEFENIYNVYKVGGIILGVLAIIFLLARVYNKQITEFAENLIKTKK